VYSTNKAVKSGARTPNQKAQRTHRTRELSGQLRRVIDLPARPIAPSLTFDEEQNGWRIHEKQPGLLEHHHIAAHVRMTAMPDGAVLLVWTRRLFLGCVTPCVNEGMERLPTSHQKKGQRANGQHLPA